MTLYVLLFFNSAAATLTGLGLVCMGERVTVNCTVSMGTLLAWRYDSMQVGPAFTTESTPDTTTLDPVGGITFTVAHISNNGGILMSRLSFIAVMATNGQMITCSGDDNNLDAATIQIGSGQYH